MQDSDTKSQKSERDVSKLSSADKTNQKNLQNFCSCVILKKKKNEFYTKSNSPSEKNLLLPVWCLEAIGQVMVEPQRMMGNEVKQ